MKKFINNLKNFNFRKIALSLFLINVSFTSAQEISEIMYDPSGSDTGNEWVEIYNNTNNPVDLTMYKLFEANVNHGISAVSAYLNPNGNILALEEYAIIADNPATFLLNHSGFSGKLFDSSFSLSNTGELLELRGAGGAALSSTAYLPQANANGTGGTLNYINNSWQVYTETPGASSTLISITNSVNSTNTNSTTTNSTNITNNTSSGSVGSYASYSSSGSNRFTLGDLRLLVPREINTVVGAETEFFVKNIDSKNTVVNANTYWSFGDGAEGIGSTTTHRYQNVGVYNAFIESQVSSSYGVDKIIVKVENPNIEISDVQDNYVELYNKGDVELNIGRFMIASDQGVYQLSRMFIISPNSKVKIDGRVLGFSKLTNVKLMSAYSTLITNYNNPKQILLQNNLLNNFATSSDFANSNITNLTHTASSSNVLNKKKIIYKKPIKIVSSGFVPKQNPKLTKLTENISSSVGTSSSVIGEKGSTNFVKKWLYWIYE